MTRAAKLVWNTNNWEKPDGSDEKIGVHVEGPNGNYIYGLEEFLRSPEQMGMRIGYLDCYRHNDFIEPENVALFSLNPVDHNILHVGNLYHVCQIQNAERLGIWNDFNEMNYIQNIVNPAFCEIEDLNFGENASGTEVFVNHNYGIDVENLPNIQGAAPNGFFVNIRYDRLNYFPNPVNLTEIYPGINMRWKHLSVLFKVENSPSQELIEYLQNSFR